ncbi:hypothetical protein HaLaN_31898, partial [Haematococcus lacustris]
MAVSTAQTSSRAAPASRGPAPLRISSLKPLPARRSVAMRFKEGSELDQAPPSTSQPQ